MLLLLIPHVGNYSGNYSFLVCLSNAALEDSRSSIGACENFLKPIGLMPLVSARARLKWLRSLAYALYSSQLMGVDVVRSRIMTSTGFPKDNPSRAKSFMVSKQAT